MSQQQKKSKYNLDWEDPDLHPNIAPWIQKVNTVSPDDNCYFRCKVCGGGKLALSNMGIRAVLSHMTDKKCKKDGTVKICKHNKNMQSINKTKRNSFFTSVPSASPVVNTDPATELAPGCTASTSNALVVPTDNVLVPVQNQATIRLDTAPKEVIECWIRWALDVVHSHHSLNSSGNKGKLFKSMFQDHPNAESFGQLSPGKLKYIINYGLAEYFMSIISKELVPKDRLPPKFVSYFDESFNKVTYSKQMDVHVFYYDEQLRQVQRLYIGSQFMGHGTPEDTMEEFIAAHKGMDIMLNLVLLSMDGPNVNWSFHKELEEYRSEQNPEAPYLLQLGSCELHVLHGAYQAAHSKETNWEVKAVMKAAHGILKKSPARRADYFKDNGIDNDGDDQTLKAYFPLKFAGHRWLKNGKALSRYLEIKEKLDKFLKNPKEFKRKNFDSKDERKPLLLRVTHSKLFTAYCEFSLSVCRDIEPFLNLFQAERPLAVFLYAKLFGLVLSLMNRFARKNVLNENSTPFKLMKLDLRKEENLIPAGAVNVGFGAKKVLRELKTTEKTQERSFRLEARSFLSRVLEKIFERCPLKYKMARAISSLSPIEITTKNADVLEKRFDILLNHLSDCEWLSTTKAEKAEKQYKELLSNPDFLAEAKEFDLMKDRVHVFLSRILDSDKNVELEYVVRIIMILSHSNARVESGFSINGDILLPNMLSGSIVAQRLVYDAVPKLVVLRRLISPLK